MCHYIFFLKTALLPSFIMAAVTDGGGVLRFFKLNKSGLLPTRAYEGDAGYDLYASEGVPRMILAGEKVMVKTSIGVHLPPHTFGQLASRSGLAQNGLTVVSGV